MKIFNGLSFLSSGGETGSLIQAFNWSNTPLGAIEEWSHSLKVALQILLSSRFPMQILWGADYIQFYNDAYIPIAGNKHPTALGQRAAECWQEVWDFSGPLLDRVMATGEATWSEDQPLVLNRNGRPDKGYFTFSYTPIWDESGKVGGIFIAVNETTQKILGERRERALRAEAQTAKENLENVLSSISDEFMMFDSNWCFTYINDRAVAALQKPREELLGQCIWEIFPEVIETSFYQGLHQAVNAQTATSFEYFSVGEGRWLENRVYPLGNGVSLLRVDITERKKLEQALQASQTQINSLLNTAPASIAQCRFFSNRTYIVDYHSVGCEALTGYTPNEITSELWSARILPEDRDAISNSVFDAVFQQKPIAVEYRFRHKDGSLRWISDSLTSRRDDERDCWIVTMVGIDITPRKQAQEALRRSEAHLSMAQRVAQFGSWEFYPCNQRSVWSEAMFDQFGFDPTQGEPSYSDLMQRIHPGDRDIVEQYTKQAIVEGKPYALDLRVLLPDGSIRYLHSRCEPVFDAQRQVVKLMGTCLDITERKQIEIALQESEERLQLALQGADCGTWDYDLISQKLIWSDRCKVMFGIDPALEMSFAVFFQAIHPDDRERIHQAVEEAIAHQQNYDVEMRTLWSDGTVRWVRSIGRVYYNPQGLPYRMAGVALDISHLKQTEIALCESEERYRYLVEATPQLVWTADARGRNTYVSQQMCDYIGLSSDQLLNLNWQAVIHPDDVEQVFGRWMQSVQTGIPYEAEYRLRRADGAYRWQLVRAKPSCDEQGQIIQWFGVSTDIHDKQELEQQRAYLLQQAQAAREEAERANRIKDEFLAVLSHELRSPLNPILGWAKLLRMHKLDAGKTEYALETIERNAKLQAQLIDDLLDVSRILRGKLILNSTPISLIAVIEDALETVRSVSEAKGIQVQTRLDPSPFQISGDANRLKQVLWNLLSNAVKFTPQGGQVTVTLDYGSDLAQIQVIDTGKGIHADFLPHVFDRFRQADSTTTRVFGGLGLGLAIAHQIVEMHGGTIEADSSGEGQGATFTVQLPLIPGTAASPIPDSRSATLNELHHVHVLVIEDDADNRALIVMMLQEFGAKVTAVPSAVAAMSALSRIKPDILISDIGMPGMDGYMLMQQIREVTHTHQIPAIALTSYTGQTDQQKALSVGFQKHLAKPVEPIQLVEAISALVRTRP